VFGETRLPTESVHASSAARRTGLSGTSGLLGPGYTLGSRYHIIRLPGAGGMGAVYQAWDDELDVAVAIKRSSADTPPVQANSVAVIAIVKGTRLTLPGVFMVVLLDRRSNRATMAWMPSDPHSDNRTSSTVSDRILGSLQGVATGDAIGKQTETLSREAVARWYPDGVRGFEGTPGTTIPRYVGNPRREWLIGETTDDTERTIAVARAILEDGEVRHATVGRELLSCRKSVHPSIKSLWEFHKAGDPARVAQCHEGCGAAIRVAPVGAMYRPERLEEIVAAAYEASISTHGGTLALAAAAATAAAVSAAIDGASASDIVGLAEQAATHVEYQRSGSANASIAGAIRGVHVELSRWTTLEPDEVAAAYFPRTPLTVVPLAIALATILESAEAAILLAANAGGDSDSVASIAGAILGARYPETINDDWYAVVERINHHDLVSLAGGLGRLRR
jgi:ADP-ribosylglycohydrolase